MSKETLNIAVLGPSESGKSTLVGHLMFLAGAIDPNTMNQLSAEADNLGRSSFKYAFLCDKAGKQRDDDPAFSLMVTDKLKYDLRFIRSNSTDEFAQDAVSGVPTVDAVILVSSGGDLDMEQVSMAKILGATQLVVAVNKMDSANYSEATFNELKTSISTSLVQNGWTNSVSFIPTAGYVGDNLITKSSEMPWYNGNTLLEVIDTFQTPQLGDRPLRLPLKDVYNIRGIGTVPVGRVAAGVIKKDVVALFAPSTVEAKVKSVEHKRSAVPQGVRGMDIGCSIASVGVSDIKRGYVISDKNNSPARGCINFCAQIMALKNCPTLKVGSCPIVGCHKARVTCKITSIHCKIDKDTGKTLEASPTNINAGDTYLATLTPLKPMCVEKFEDYPELGRFYFSDGMSRDILAVGFIKKVFKQM